MKVVLAKNAGFCMGVRRAVDTTLDTTRKERGAIATYGPLIHNPQVLEMLKEKGVRTLKAIPEEYSGTIIIRAHGVPPAEKEQLRASGATVQDATCPRVVKVQAIIRKYSGQGYSTVIVGDRDHAEVIGLLGYARPEGHVVSGAEDIEQLDLTGPYIIVSQTTQDELLFGELQTAILQRFPGGKVFNTICDSTHKRQEEVRWLCETVDAVVVVGGKASANTQRLGDIVKSMGKPVFMAETEEDLDTKSLGQFDLVGVTAGASTPTWVINRVVQALESLPGRNDSAVRIRLGRWLHLLLAMNLYVALGGAAVAYAGSLMQSIIFDQLYAWIAFCYVFAMHNMNRLADLKAKQFNDPFRAQFLDRYRPFLLTAAALLLVTALVAATRLGTADFWILLGMSVMGILYSVRILPASVAAFVHVKGLREIPGSKTFFVALAWAFVTVLLPALGDPATLPLRAAGVFLVVMLFVYLRSALFDILDLQGDRIAGKETLPVCFGEKKTIRLIYRINGFLAFLLIGLPLAGILPMAALIFLPCTLYLGILTRMYDKGGLKQGLLLEICIESVFPLMAFCAWLGLQLPFKQ